MSLWSAALLALIGGLFVGTQSLMNAAIRLKAGFAPMILINALPIFLLSLALILHHRFVAKAAVTPLWWPLYLSGCLGTIFVILTVISLPRLGGTWALMIIVLGQLLAGMIADHFGWFGLPQTPVSLSRVAGVLLVLVGCWVFNR